VKFARHSIQCKQRFNAQTKALTKLTQGQRSLNLKMESVIANSIAEDVTEASGLREQIERLDTRVQKLERLSE
jgi:hypothetical protein